MKFLVTGVNGQLGHDVMNELKKRGHEGIGSDISESSADPSMAYVSLDITDGKAVDSAVTEIRPDAIIHCAAWTAVDAAEDPLVADKVRAINVDGTRYIAEAAKKVDAKMTYISTDYVFDGQGERPWLPDDKNYAPINIYGKTKLEGELAVSETLEKYFIVRIAWVFGINGKNFIKTMLSVGRNHDELRVVNDQIGTPTYTYDLARLLVDMNETGKYGYYHATNEGGYISWYDFTVEILRQATEYFRSHSLSYIDDADTASNAFDVSSSNINTSNEKKASAREIEPMDYSHVTVHPVSTTEYGLSVAPRPFNSRLDKAKLREQGFEPLPTWQDALSRYLNELYK